MPLDRSGSDGIEVGAGKPRKQAIAIALNVKKKALKGSWERHPETGKFVSSKPRPPAETGGWTAPPTEGRKTFNW